MHDNMELLIQYSHPEIHESNVASTNPKSMKDGIIFIHFSFEFKTSLLCAVILAKAETDLLFSLAIPSLEMLHSNLF